MRSIYVLVAPVVMILAVLACAGTPLTGMPLFVCPTDAPLPTITTLPGTATPTTAPTATPYIITPPQDFYLDDPVRVGNPAGAVQVQFRLTDVATLPASPARDGSERMLVLWQLEVTNLGFETYSIAPTVVLTLTTIRTPGGLLLSGDWVATERAGEEAGVVVDTNLVDIPPGDTRVFQFAAYTPPGTPERWTLELDIEGDNRLTWINAINPYC